MARLPVPRVPVPRRCAAALVALLVLGASPASAQRRSEKGVVAQTVGNTTVTVEYYRPVARGRDSLFGRLVKWGEHWTPGANWAATIDVDHDVLVEGKPLPKGKYSIWTIVRPDRWTVDFHRSARRFHLSRPDSTDRQLRVEVRTDTGPHTEVLTFDFPRVVTGATTLRLRWGTTVVPIGVGMIAPPLVMVPKPERARYVGRYDVELFALEPGQRVSHRLIDIVEVSDTLRWRDVENPGQRLRDFVLSPGGGDYELTRAQRTPDGQLWAEAGVSIAFTMVGDRAGGFVVKVDDAVPVSRATRVQR